MCPVIWSQRCTPRVQRQPRLSTALKRPDLAEHRGTNAIRCRVVVVGQPSGNGGEDLRRLARSSPLPTPSPSASTDAPSHPSCSQQTRHPPHPSLGGKAAPSATSSPDSCPDPPAWKSALGAVVLRACGLGEAVHIGLGDVVQPRVAEHPADRIRRGTAKQAGRVRRRRGQPDLGTDHRKLGNLWRTAESNYGSSPYHLGATRSIEVAGAGHRTLAVT